MGGPIGRGRELDGYHVVPRQLAKAGDELMWTGRMLNSVVSDVEGTFLRNDDLGFLGAEADAPSSYNQGMRVCADHFRTLSRTVTAAGEILNQVAGHYAAMDDEYYRRFGRLDDK